MSTVIPTAEVAAVPALDDVVGWTRRVPDGAISVQSEGTALVLRASHSLQERFQYLLAARKAGTITPDENLQYEAICRLDDALSWLNRLVRGTRV